jgi:hypothetical protein
MGAAVFEALKPIYNFKTDNPRDGVGGEIDLRCGKGTKFEEEGREFLLLRDAFEVVFRDEMSANVIEMDGLAAGKTFDDV